MNLRFTSPHDQKPGVIASMLKRCYAKLITSDPALWMAEECGWDEFDRDVFENPHTIGACVLLSWFGIQLVGFSSYDPRQKPELGIVGHNCILPEFQRRGFGQQQIQEILRVFEDMGIRLAKASTNDDSFFIPAQRMYMACGFHEVRRVPWNRKPNVKLIEYEKRLDRV
jgi:GNAT superfamily N-acetyltransferase